ncbi:ankyrin [Pluteus cervinus]|uniref:Ankyrin n=1 Tax=Pluteus cervinus TaxID=181527 RepID=A0ACD3AES1_9AGAR|nr:ankyrin [Pluteus cervinus]
MSSQNAEAQAFIKRVVSLPKGPGISLDDALKPSLDDEADLRRLFATEKDNARLKDPYVGLIDIFSAPGDIRTTRARVVKDDEDLAAKYVMPLTEVDRRKEGTSSMANDLEEFKKSWAIFTEASLSTLDWSNVVAAGGAVQACLAPLSDETKSSKKNLRKHLHTVAYPTSDVDLFIWGLTPEQAEVKMHAIYNAVQDAVPWDVTCVRTKHTVSIHSQYPYRSIQIVLRLYSSPAEILAGFDIDVPCFAYNGTQVWGNPRAIVAMMRQCNTVDMTRRSPSYEVRLAKYSLRGFEVLVPSLKRQDIDPTIYERSIARIEGLARLLVFERLMSADDRETFLKARRTLRGRPDSSNYRGRGATRALKGDLKANMDIGGLEMNDYDVVSLHIPYGPGWHSGRIDKLVYQTDLGMNSTFNPKNKDRRLHRHAAFFGSMTQCIEDCCRYCPEPKNDEEKELQKNEDEKYIRGRIAFVQDDPGRQSITGSFNPIDVGEWAEQVYIGDTEKFFTAISTHNRKVVVEMINAGHDVNRRDHVGRMPLHVAILSKAVAIAIDLIEAGARITARLVDGRNALHLAVQMDLMDLVRRLLQKSKENEEEVETEKEKEGEEKEEEKEKPKEKSKGKAKAKEDADEDVEMASADAESGSDKSSNSGGDDDWEKVSSAEPSPDQAMIPDDDDDEPDILDINQAEWDFGFTPLCFAVAYGSIAIVNELLTAGADPKLVSKSNRKSKVFPLAVAITREDEEEAVKVVERLLMAKVPSSMADNDDMYTVLHRAVQKNRVKVVMALLKSDPNANALVKFPAISSYSEVCFPVVTAIAQQSYAMLATLLAFGAKLTFSDEDILQPYEARPRGSGYQHIPENPKEEAFLPLETALARRDDVFHLLIALDAQFNVTIKRGAMSYASSEDHKCLLDWVTFAIDYLTKRIEGGAVASSIPSSSRRAGSPSKSKPRKAQSASRAVASGSGSGTWAEFITAHWDKVKRQKEGQDIGEEDEEGVDEKVKQAKKEAKEEEQQRYKEAKEYFAAIKKVLASKKAKTYKKLYPDATKSDDGEEESDQKVTPKFLKLDGDVPIGQRFNDAYTALYEACFTGDDEKVSKLCEEGASEKLGPLIVGVVLQPPKDMYTWDHHYTPLSAAIQGRKWSTAKLVLNIAGKQYKPSDKPTKFSTAGIKLASKKKDGSDDGSGSEDEDEEDEEDSVDSDGSSQSSNKVIDVAENAGARSRTTPTDLLTSIFSWFCKGSLHNGNFIQKAVQLGDFEAFVQLLEMYNGLPKKGSTSTLNEDLILKIIEHDHPEMLDHFIRWTGLGINIRLPKTKGSPSQEDLEAAHADSKLYLGLDVNGKKRIDLARKHDPNANETSVQFPMLWHALRFKAKGVAEYLGGTRSLAAYKFYMQSTSDKRAKDLKQVPDLEKVLPEWLGWTVDQVIGDSPLVGALKGGNLELLKRLFTHSPKLMESTLKLRIKFSGENPLHLAIKAQVGVDVFDFLLEKKVDVEALEKQEGWNILHMICNRQQKDLLAHLLKKLPRHVNESLLVQRGKKGVTPLHLAVQTSNKTIVAMIADYTKLTLLTRDAGGSTPLHLAVTNGYAEITRILVEASPPEVLYMENAVGATPLEIAQLFDLQDRLGENESHELPYLAGDEVEVKERQLNFDKLQQEVPRYVATIEELSQIGKLRKRTKLLTELTKFGDVLQGNLERASASLANARQDESDLDNRKDGKTRTYVYIKGRLASYTGERQLVHVIDVQKSVQADLPEKPERTTRVAEADREGFEAEDSEDNLNKCFAWMYL